MCGVQEQQLALPDPGDGQAGRGVEPGAVEPAERPAVRGGPVLLAAQSCSAKETMPGSNAASGTAVGTARSTRVVGAAIWTRQNPAPVCPPPMSLPGATVTAVMSLPLRG